MNRMYQTLVARVLGKGMAALAGLALAGGAPAGAQPLLSEVFYDALGSDDGWVFVEIAGEPGTDLSGWKVAGRNGANGATVASVELVGVIAADGLFLLADRTGGGATFTADADQVANFDLQNGPDSVLLLDGDRVVDALGYGVFGPGEFSFAEGAPAPDAPAGSSLGRRFANLDTGDNASDFEILSAPTPGQAVFLPVPEPGSGLALLAGLAALAALRRPGPESAPLSFSSPSSEPRLPGR